MSNARPKASVLSAFVLAVGIFSGLAALGAVLGQSALRFREYERTVTVKGLSEQEWPADIVLWPIRFSAADNDLTALYAKLDEDAGRIRTYLVESGIDEAEINTAPPNVVDKLAQAYGDSSRVAFRYSATQSVTVYSGDVERVRRAIAGVAELGKNGIAFMGDDYQNQTQYIFTRLNEVKPGMVEEATRHARSVALKFAEDSESQLGKIKRAHQGHFSINSRDSQTPHIKKVRVVSTIEYYLSD